MTSQRHDRQALDGVLDVEQLCAGLRNEGFDLRRSASVSYLLEAGQRPGAALTAAARARTDGWDVSLYADSSGWVVRVTRTGPPSPRLLTTDRAYVEELAGAHDLALRGVVVEDLEQHDPWQALAARARRPSFR